MSIWDAHYDALYAASPAGFGKPALLVLGSDPVLVTAIPKLGGVSVPAPRSGSGGDGFELQTLQPAADVRMSELNAKGVTDLIVLRRAAIEVAGETWRIESWRMKPSPEGEANGEVRLMLSKAS
jgi:hypothetical protein